MHAIGARVKRAVGHFLGNLLAVWGRFPMGKARPGEGVLVQTSCRLRLRSGADQCRSHAEVLLLLCAPCEFERRHLRSRRCSQNLHPHAPTTHHLFTPFLRSSHLHSKIYDSRQRLVLCAAPCVQLPRWS
jgi:hypothetical protein